MTKREIYESKFISIPEALEKIRSGDAIAVGHYGNEPRNLLRQLHTIRDRVEDVTVWINNPSEEYPFIMDNSLKGRIDLLSAFYGAPLRKIHPSGRVSFAPHNMHSLSQTIIETKKPHGVYGSGHAFGRIWLRLHVRGAQQMEAGDDAGCGSCDF